MFKPFKLITTMAAFTATIFAQTQTFTGFTSGNLVVSRTVYSGDATTVTVGQPLPPVCPATAACGTAKATANGAYPDVFANNKADGSFGITSPLFLDQLQPNGTLVSTLAVPTNLVTTSFSSKSEVALNLSQDGTAITFMGYMAPVNSIDVSNSNTPGVYDPTNPAGGSYFRAVVQVSQNGNFQVTPTNAYSGNNGRAAILAGGQYYMVGNSNNGSGTPDNVINATGAEIATPGQPATTAPTQIGTFSITQVNDPATGKPYAADKLGKDNNFRGLTVFNNTVYVTKGSGSNGINTVYQLGPAGTLPTLANAASTVLTVLPGLPTTLAKNPDAMFPFGIWFANANTLYIGDEGDGTIANAATSKTSGLQKWVLANGKWSLAYVLQTGLNLGQPYSVANYPAALNPATDGLRNIAGRVNADGTATIYAVTSTVSANGDQGADPNKLVAITDVLAATAAPATAVFTTLKSAQFGEVLRGVSFAPTGTFFAAPATPTVLSAATPSIATVAPNSLGTINGQNLATTTATATATTLPTTLGGTTVSITDASGSTFPAPLLYVSPSQINFQLPAGIASGIAQFVIANSNGTATTGTAVVAPVAPGLFTANNAGLIAANAIQAGSKGNQTLDIAAPIDLTAGPVYLVMYATGLRAAGLANTKVTIGGVSAPVLYAGAQGPFAGLDQVNVIIPASLAGKGNVNIRLTANGIAANAAQIAVK